MTYDEIPALRASDLVHYLDCPARYKYERENRKESPALLRGQLVHAMVFEADEVDLRFAAMPDGIDRRTKAGKEEHAAFIAANANRAIVDSATWAECLEISLAVRSFDNEDLRAALASDHALREHALTWTDERTGIACKCKLDLFHDGIAWDLKTCRDARGFRFKHACVQYAYHVKAAFYLRGLRANGYQGNRWVWIAANAKAPRFIQLHSLTNTDREQADAIIDDILDMHAECERTGNFYAYDTKITDLSMPAYANGEDDIEIDFGNGDTLST